MHCMCQDIKKSRIHMAAEGMAPAESEGVKALVSWRCPYAMRALIGLKLKGVEYVEIQQDLVNKSELLLTTNPIHKKVPVLIHNRKVIVESLIILEYLDEAWPEDEATGTVGFLSKDPFERSQQRFWADYAAKIFGCFYRIRVAKDEGEKEAANKDFAECFATLDSALSKLGEYFGGEKIGLADIALAPAAVYVPVLTDFGLKLPEATDYPHLFKWFDLIKKSPAVEAVLPHPEKLKQGLLELIKRSKK